MIKYFCLLLISFSFLGLKTSEPLYQVTTSDPHDLESLEPNLETVFESGRLRIVKLKNPIDSKFLRPLTGSEKSYSFLSEKEQLRDPEIVRVLSQVSADRIRKDVEFLSSFQTRAAGTDENRKATLEIENRLRNYGYRTQQICYREGICSVIADKIGRSSEVNLVLGHLDSVGQKFAGADDNGSGTAVILEMARVLKDSTLDKGLRFFVTNGEENGLLGARHYVKSLEAAGTLKEISFAVNMDMVGYNSNGIVEIETNAPFEKEAQEHAHLAATYTTLKTKITIGAWGSDHVPFLEARVPAVLTIEDWSTKTPCYHRACDKPETLNYAYAAEIAKLNIASVLD